MSLFFLFFLKFERFNYHIGELTRDEKDERIRERSIGGHAYFDARIFQLEEDQLVLHNILWRSQDAVRNSKSMLGHAFLKKNAMHGLTSDEIIHRVFLERGIDYYSFPKWFHGGVLIKRSRARREALNRNPKLAAPEPVMVHRRLIVIADWIDLPSATAELLLAKNVTDIPLFEEMFKELDYKPIKSP